MKNHIAFKFIAVFFCALTMLTAALSIIGIVVLESSDLYGEDLEAQLADRKQEILLRVASDLAAREASERLGSCDDTTIIGFYGAKYLYQNYFDADRFAWAVSDETGQLLYSSPRGDHTDWTETIVALGSIHYIRVVDQDTAGETIPDGIEPSVPLTEDSEPTVSEGTEEYDIYQFPDNESGVYRTYYLAYEQAEGWTVTIYLRPGAWEQEQTAELALLLWQNRYNLFYVLAGSLLVFAISAVYLCCAAGRKPGSDEVKPGGFNALPLDLYLALVCLIFAFSWFLAEEFAYYWNSRMVVTTAALLFLGFFDCLVFVAFCFACASQFKMTGYYWLKHTAVGFTAMVLWDVVKDLLSLLVKALKWLGYHIPAGLARFFGWIIRSIMVLWDAVKDLLSLLVKALKWLRYHITAGLARFFDWIIRSIHRAAVLLPVTWQWMIAGLSVLLILFLAIVSYNSTVLILGCVYFLCLILYGAHAFGILLEAAKRMGKGDLETKVSHQLLLGSFREFAGDLNALADVAKVAAQKEMRSERMKTELITNVSHDIKTPLTSIINYVDLLQKPHTPEEELEYLEVLGRKSEQLKKLIQDLMEMSKASTGNMTVDIRQVDAVEAVNQALGEFADKLSASRLTPVVTVPEGGVTMRADGRLVWRVLSNLLSNAVKYAMPGTRLYVSVAKQGGTVRVSLKNVSAEPLNVDAEELMERFVRGDAARNTDGSGLGLNIAKSLMDVQQGRLELSIDGDLFKATLIFPAE